MNLVFFISSRLPLCPVKIQHLTLGVASVRLFITGTDWSDFLAPHLELAIYSPWPVD